MACCGYVGLLIVELMPICIAAVVGGLFGRMTGRQTTGAWIAAALGVAVNVGLAASLYYYSTHLAGGSPAPSDILRQCLGLGVAGSVIGGVGSYLLCRAMR